MLPGTPTPVLAVVVVGTCIALAAQPWRLLAWLRLIVPQHISSLYTEGKVREQRSGSGVGVPQQQQQQCRKGIDELLGNNQKDRVGLRQRVDLV